MQSRKVEIQGYPVYQCCNNANTMLRAKHTSLVAEEEKLKREIKEREARLQEIDREYEELNKEEVQSVLDYVRSYSRSNDLSITKIDSLLCHCQNKLNRNIDEVFLRFTDPKETKDESINS